MPVPTYGETAARKFGPRRMTVTIGEAALTAAALTEIVTIGAIPAGSQVLAVNIAVSPAFAGITGPVSVSIGSTGDDDALVADAVVSTAVDGMSSTRPLGISPNKVFAAETTLNATFISASGNLVDCSAGSCTIEIIYVTGLQF